MRFANLPTTQKSASTHPYSFLPSSSWYFQTTPQTRLTIFYSMVSNSFTYPSLNIFILLYFPYTPPFLLSLLPFNIRIIKPDYCIQPRCMYPRIMDGWTPSPLVKTYFHSNSNTYGTCTFVPGQRRAKKKKKEETQHYTLSWNTSQFAQFNNVTCRGMPPISLRSFAHEIQQDNTVRRRVVLRRIIKVSSSYQNRRTFPMLWSDRHRRATPFSSLSFFPSIRLPQDYPSSYSGILQLFFSTLSPAMQAD